MGSPEVQDGDRWEHALWYFLWRGELGATQCLWAGRCYQYTGVLTLEAEPVQSMALPSLCVILTVLKEKAVGSQVAECVVVMVLPGKANGYHQPQQSKCDRNREWVQQSASVVTASAGKTGDLSLIPRTHMVEG